MGIARPDPTLSARSKLNRTFSDEHFLPGSQRKGKCMYYVVKVPMTSAADFPWQACQTVGVLPVLWKLK